MYSNMVEDMLQLTKLQYGPTLECECKVFKKVIFSCTNKCFLTKHISWKCFKKCSSKKKWFDKEYHRVRKCLMILDVVKDKENGQKHLLEYKRLVQRKRRILEVTQQFLLTQEKAHARTKIWGHLKGKFVESYGDITLLDLSMQCNNFYELYLLPKR